MGKRGGARKQVAAQAGLLENIMGDHGGGFFGHRYCNVDIVLRCGEGGWEIERRTERAEIVWERRISPG